MRPLKTALMAGIIGLLPLPGFAEDLQSSVIAQLREQGYTEIIVTRTFLGRMRFVALADGVEREIVINPSTGEVLRDFSHRDDDEAEIPRLIDHRDDDDDEDEGEDDWDDEEEDDEEDWDDEEDEDDPEDDEDEDD